jgi:hypothetical protein
VIAIAQMLSEINAATIADRREAHRELCEERAEDEAIAAIAQQVTYTEETTGAGRVEHFGGEYEESYTTREVDDATFEIELDGLAMRGWYLDKQWGYWGEVDGVEWEAVVVKRRVMGRGKRRVLGLTVRVSGPDGVLGMNGVMDLLQRGAAGRIQEALAKEGV